MSDAAAGILQTCALIVALGLCYRPLGAYMARVYQGERHSRVERIVYRLARGDPSAHPRGAAYARALLAFSLVSVLLLYLLQRIQAHLPLALGLSGVEPAQAFNTA